jgi:hypothetical protein
MFWHPQERAPEEYAHLYAAARDTIRGVDPDARVVLGGLALANADVIPEAEFVQRMYRERPDLQGNVDAIGFHPYAPTVDGIYVKLREFRQTLAAVGAANVPLEITEIGWTTTKTSEADRAASLSRLASELPRSDCGIESLIPHTWLTPEQDPNDPEDWFGIVNADASQKPSGAAYLGSVRRSRGLGGDAPPSGAVAICSPATASPAAARPPRLQFRVARAKRGRRAIRAIVSCPGYCRIKLEVLAPSSAVQADVRRPVAQRSLSLRSKRRVVALPAPRGRRMVDVRATATARSGAATSKIRRARLARRAARRAG